MKVWPDKPSNVLEACRQGRLWAAAGLPPVRIAVNVSALQFASKDFLSSVHAALISTGRDPCNLELELTETVLREDAESARHTLGALKAIGVQLVIDDFGVGYSSFSCLRKFPLARLKVDRSFINDILSSLDNAMILSALINIGKSLKHRLVAEGVKTEEQLHFLQQEGCSEDKDTFSAARRLPRSSPNFWSAAERSRWSLNPSNRAGEQS